VSWSRAELGRRAAELLLDRIEAEPRDKFRRVIIPPQLVVRRSSTLNRVDDERQRAGDE
jgi:DNA-binding LacI/PurR family transcriptional regulator